MDQPSRFLFYSMFSSLTRLILNRHMIELLLIVLVASFYMPAVTQDFLYLDDHGVFSKSLAGELDPVDNYYLRDGRPLTGVALVTAVNSFDSFTGFRFLRAFSLLATICLAVYLNRLLLGAGIGKLSSGIIALAMVTTPSMAVYIGWASCFLYPLAAMAALASGQLVGQMEVGKVRPARLFLMGIAAVFLLLFSLSIYQIAATFFIIPLMLKLSRCLGQTPSAKAPNLKTLFGQTTLFGIIAFLGLLLYILTIAFLKAHYLSDSMRFGQRSNFRLPDLTGFLAHAKAMGSMVIPSWSHYLGIIAQVAIVCLLTGAAVYACTGIWVQCRKHSNFRQGLVWLLLFGIAAAPVLMLVVVDQVTTPWRLFSGTSAVLLLWLTILLTKGSRPDDIEKGRRIIYILFLTLLSVNVAIGSYVFRAGLVSPNVEETQLATGLWKLHDPNDCSLVILVAPKWYEVESTGSFEYGFRPSGLTGLFPRQAFRSFYANAHGRAALSDGLQIIVLNEQLPMEVPSGVCVYTLQEVAGDRYRVDTMEMTPAWHKTFGAVMQLKEGVFYSENYGYFFETAWDWYFNPAMGRILVVPENNAVESMDPDAVEASGKAEALNTDWVWSERLDEWIQLRDLKESGERLIQ